MRDPNRLDDFYDRICELHKTKVSDWRFGQFMCNFFIWLFNEKKLDCFFIEEDQMLKYLEEFFY